MQIIIEGQTFGNPLGDPLRYAPVYVISCEEIAADDDPLIHIV